MAHDAKLQRKWTSCTTEAIRKAEEDNDGQTKDTGQNTGVYH